MEPGRQEREPSSSWVDSGDWYGRHVELCDGAGVRSIRQLRKLRWHRAGEHAVPHDRLAIARRRLLARRRRGLGGFDAGVLVVGRPRRWFPRRRRQFERDGKLDRPLVESGLVMLPLQQLERQ